MNNPPDVPTFREDDLLALLGSPDIDSEGISVHEIVQHTGWSESAARSRVRKLYYAGQLTVMRKRALRMDGIETLVPAYRLRTL
jgi:hypothetical protein